MTHSLRYNGFRKKERNRPEARIPVSGMTMKNANDKKWMIRRDGKAFACRDFVYCGTGVDEALIAAQWLYRHTADEKTKKTVLRLFKTYGQLQSCYRDAVTSLLIDIASREDGDFLDPVFIRSIADRIRSAPMGKLSSLIASVNSALNEEFLRTECVPAPASSGPVFEDIADSANDDSAINGGAINGGTINGGTVNGGDASGRGYRMRVSSDGFDWFPVIRSFFANPRNSAGVRSVSVVREERCAG